MAKCTLLLWTLKLIGRTAKASSVRSLNWTKASVRHSLTTSRLSSNYRYFMAEKPLSFTRLSRITRIRYYYFKLRKLLRNVQWRSGFQAEKCNTVDAACTGYTATSVFRRTECVTQLVKLPCLPACWSMLRVVIVNTARDCSRERWIQVR